MLKLSSILFALILIFSQGCSNPESSARKLYNEGMTLQQEGNNEQAIVIYKKIVSSYPDTETAVEVNKILLSLSLIKKITTNKESIKETLHTALNLFHLENGSYPSTNEGLQALVYQPSGYPHWKGSYIQSSIAKAISNFNYQNKNGDIVLTYK